MKIPCFVAESLFDFLRIARACGTKETSDGKTLTIYGLEIGAPERCPGKSCQSQNSMHRNGYYLRQAIEGVIWVYLRICRFRCRVCGITASSLYSFLVPHRRFTGKLICQSIDEYGKKEQAEAEEGCTSYNSISVGLSIYGDGDDEVAGSEEKEPAPAAALASKDKCCPVRTTVFSWIDFVCKRITKTVREIEKELILKGVPPGNFPWERFIKNSNAWKAGRLARYKRQNDKAKELNKLSYALELSAILQRENSITAEKLRAYFLQFSERCFDILSDAVQTLPITQSFEQPG